MKIKSTNVLILDDDKLILRALSKSLSRVLGIDNVVTLNDATLVDHYLTNSEVEFNLFITDFQMPFLNGVDVLKIVQQHSPKTIRVLMSGDLEHLQTNSKNIPANLFLPKPFSIGDIKHLGNLLDQIGKVHFEEEAQIQLGLIPYIPVPDEKTCSEIISNGSTGNHQLDKLNETVCFDTKASQLSSKCLEITYKLIHILEAITDQLIDTVGLNKIRAAFQHYYDWAARSYRFAIHNAVHQEDAEDIFHIVLSYVLNHIFRDYLHEISMKTYEIQLLDRFAIIWGVDPTIVEKRRTILNASDLSSNDLISSVSLNCLDSKKAQDIFGSDNADIQSLTRYLDGSKQENKIKESIL
ncbi:response regulator transcription factor [Pseudoalteromonas luteoviolacea]|uniref:response regulator transcription factor n=1 Tax=Pseudoalteromonas luteoviolacea TaxID=43657 RepID=UPI001B392682|nr:response regulator [Pseudoalteromonas luteoviolacea]MBQ4835293.1 response regulator [Pseudoalteromonas luteoviolacea]